MDGRFKKGLVPWNKKEKTIRKCRVCDKEMALLPWQMKTENDGKFCSKKCFYIGRRPGFVIGKRLPWLIHNKPHTDEAKRKISLAGIGKHDGPKNWRWINDRSKVKVSDRSQHDPLYKQWCKGVKNRDGWACMMKSEECSGRLEAHHVVPWRLEQSLRYETSNGITLCKYHHPRKREKEIAMEGLFRSLINNRSEL